MEAELNAGQEEVREEGQLDSSDDSLLGRDQVEEEGEQAAAAQGLTAAQLGQLREVLVAANPEAVPELIAGETFEALLASVEPARAAFARIKEVAAQGLTAGVPRGGGTREVDLEVYGGLSPEGKIAVGLARRG